MSGRLRTYIRRHHLALICLFLIASGGTAYATHPGGANTVSTDDIINGQVQTLDIGAAQVMNSDIAASSVPSSKIVDGSVASVDVRDDTLGGGGLGAQDLAPDAVDTSELAGGSVTGAEVEDGSLDGSDIADTSSLRTAEIDEASLDGLDGDSGFDDLCAPTSTTFDPCEADATVTIGREMNVLVIAMNQFASNGAPPATGNCRVTRNDVAVSGDFPIGELDPDDDTRPIGFDIPAVFQGGMSLTQVQTLAAGTYSFEVWCNSTAGAIEFRNVSIAAVELAQD